MSPINLMGFVICSDPVSEVVSHALESKGTCTINTLNPHSYIEQKNDEEFSRALRGSDILIPDGSGIILAARLLKKAKLNKIAGYDLFIESMYQVNNKKGRVFFLGSTSHVLKTISSRMSVEYPNICVNYYSPPFKAEFEQKDILEFAKIISEFRPDILCIGLTAPKQEKIALQLSKITRVKVIESIGAVFDFYAGTVRRPAQIWIKLHLEWLIRFVGEPRRLWRRNFISTPKFIYEVFVLWLKSCKASSD